MPAGRWSLGVPDEVLELGESQLRRSLPGVAAIGSIAVVLSWFLLPDPPLLVIAGDLVLLGFAASWLFRAPQHAHRSASLVAIYLICATALWFVQIRDSSLLVYLGAIALAVFYLFVDRRYLALVMGFGVPAFAGGLWVSLSVSDWTINAAVANLLWVAGLTLHFARVRMLSDLSSLHSALRRERDGLARALAGQRAEAEERRRVERAAMAAEKFESLGRIAGGVAHDFNNMLTGIVGNVELARLSEENPTQLRESLDGIETSALAASELCGNLLDFAGGRAHPSVVVELESVIASAVAAAKPSIPSSIEIEVCPATEAVPSIDGDPTQLRQLLFNLLTNAADAIGEKPGTIRVETRSDGERVEISVCDSGPGLDATTRDRIFEPFFSTRPSGRGLGLSTVLGIVRAHRGEIRADDDPGGGARFRVDFPVSEQAQPALSAPRAGRDEGARTGRRVLVVDDDPEVLRTARGLLQALGLEVRSAASGPEALRVLADRPETFAAALVDATMPGMRGWETIRRLRERAPMLPVLLTSGFQKDALDLPALPGPPIRFLPKPYTLPALRERLRGMLRSVERNADSGPAERVIETS